MLMNYSRSFISSFNNPSSVRNVRGTIIANLLERASAAWLSALVLSGLAATRFALLA
jgi:phosphoketolase